MKSHREDAEARNKTRLQVKRSAELWLFSFADMYLIISVFFIATTAIYAKKAHDAVAGRQAVRQEKTLEIPTPSASRGPASASVQIGIEFKAGSSDLTEDAIENLKTILPLLAELKSGYVEIEGYADKEPLSKDSEFTSNFELSSVRAVQVASWFMERGVPESRVRATAFGSGHKLSGKNGLKTDRRVVVKFFSAVP